MMKNTIKKNSLFTKIVISILTMLSVSTVYYLERSFFWLEHTYEVMDAIHVSQRLTLETQDSVRGYLLSHKPYFLMDHNNYINKIMPSIDTVQELTKDNIIQQRNVVNLRELMSEKLTRIHSNVAQANIGNFDAAISNIVEGSGEKLSQRIDQLTDEMINHERNLMVERKKNVDTSVFYAVYGIPLLFILVLILTKLGF